MSTLYTVHSLALRNRPFSFADGLASAFDYSPFTNSYNVSASPEIADARAIASDFFMIGDDMRTALSEYARTQ